MYELQMREQFTGNAWIYEGHKSGSVSELRDHTTLQNVDYRIVDESGAVVWTDAKRKAPRVYSHADAITGKTYAVTIPESA